MLLFDKLEAPNAPVTSSSGLNPMVLASVLRTYRTLGMEETSWDILSKVEAVYRERFSGAIGYREIGFDRLGMEWLFFSMYTHHVYYVHAMMEDIMDAMGSNPRLAFVREFHTILEVFHGEDGVLVDVEYTPEDRLFCTRSGGTDPNTDLATAVDAILMGESFEELLVMTRGLFVDHLEKVLRRANLLIPAFLNPEDPHLYRDYRPVEEGTDLALTLVRNRAFARKKATRMCSSSLFPIKAQTPSMTMLLSMVPSFESKEEEEEFCREYPQPQTDLSDDPDDSYFSDMILAQLRKGIDPWYDEARVQSKRLRPDAYWAFVNGALERSGETMSAMASYIHMGNVLLKTRFGHDREIMERLDSIRPRGVGFGFRGVNPDTLEEHWYIGKDFYDQIFPLKGNDLEEMIMTAWDKQVEIDLREEQGRISLASWKMTREEFLEENPELEEAIMEIESGVPSI